MTPPPSDPKEQPMPDALPEFLVNYLTQRDTARATRAAAFLDSLTARERALFHDAAVMGYIQGLMRERSEGELKDSQTMALVVDACFAFPDLYAAVNADPAPHPATSTWTFEGNYESGTWHGIGSDYLNDEYDQALTDFKQRAENDKQHRKFRMIRADTVYTVVAEHDPQEGA